MTLQKIRQKSNRIFIGLQQTGRTTLNGGQVQISRPNGLKVGFAKYDVMLFLLYSG